MRARAAFCKASVASCAQNLGAIGRAWIFGVHYAPMLSGQTQFSVSEPSQADIRRCLQQEEDVFSRTALNWPRQQQQHVGAQPESHNLLCTQLNQPRHVSLFVDGASTQSKEVQLSFVVKLGIACRHLGVLRAEILPRV
jgi:hypothetical protein